MVKSWIHTESLWSYYIVCISVRPHGVSSDGCDDARKLHKSFCPEKPLRRGALTHKRIYTILHTETFTQRSLYTEELLQAEVFTIFYAQTLLHIEEFTHRGFDTEGPLHTDSFTHKRFYTEDFDVFARRSLYTKESFARRSLYTDEAFTQRSLYTEELLHTEGLHTRTQKLLQRSLYTEELLHTSAFTHGSFYTSLHRGAFAHKLFYTEKLLHKEVFTQRITEELLNTEGFARRSFSTKKLLHWGAICRTLATTLNRNFTPVFDMHFVRKGGAVTHKIRSSPHVCASDMRDLRRGSCFANRFLAAPAAWRKKIEELGK